MKSAKTRRRAVTSKKIRLTRAAAKLYRSDPKRAAIKRRVHHQRPLHKRIALHPLSVMIVLCVGVFITGWTYQVVADFYTLTATVAAPALTQGAAITSPADEATVNSAPIAVSGTCPTGSYVKLDRNGNFSGVAWCAADNTFTITTDLYVGQNTLTAQDYNITDGPGPATPGVTITYTPPTPVNLLSSTSDNQTTASPSSSTPSTTSPLLLSGDFHYQTFAAGTSYSWNLQIKGGQAPYTVHTDWGDSQASTMQVPFAQTITLSHTYAKAGYYMVLVKATDHKGAVDVLQLVAVMRSTNSAANPSSPGIICAKTASANCTGNNDLGGILAFFKNTAKLLLVAWPSFLIVSLMLVSYWLGERAKIAHLHHK